MRLQHIITNLHDHNAAGNSEVIGRQAKHLKDNLSENSKRYHDQKGHEGGFHNNPSAFTF